MDKDLGQRGLVQGILSNWVLHLVILIGVVSFAAIRTEIWWAVLLGGMWLLGVGYGKMSIRYDLRRLIVPKDFISVRNGLTKEERDELGARLYSFMANQGLEEIGGEQIDRLSQEVERPGSSTAGASGTGTSAGTSAGTGTDTSTSHTNTGDADTTQTESEVGASNASDAPESEAEETRSFDDVETEEMINDIYESDTVSSRIDDIKGALDSSEETDE
ncbi:MAG: hypothetical protein SXQ77_13060 [Halobacteria archaeon]|nr:hypothetical protein [Halobacteria archaeon]